MSREAISVQCLRRRVSCGVVKCCVEVEVVIEKDVRVEQW
jgi:hypothetical protein